MKTKTKTNKTQMWKFNRQKGKGYEGVAAIFQLPTDNQPEYIVIAPSIDALDKVVQAKNLRSGLPVDRTHCVPAVMTRSWTKAKRTPFVGKRRVYAVGMRHTAKEDEDLTDMFPWRPR